MDSKSDLRHHGILGQRWGKRNGPPYPLGGGDYSQAERKAIYKKRKQPNSIYNKKHFDEVLRADKTTLSTLSYDRDRTKNTDMFYATHNVLDKHQYNALFNRKVPQTIYDENGNSLGTGTFLKYRIDNSLKQNIKVASEDSGAEVFRSLYKKDRDFYNFVTDDARMQSYFVSDKYKFKGYREARDVLKRMRNDIMFRPLMNCRKCTGCLIMLSLTTAREIHVRVRTLIHRGLNSSMHVSRLGMEQFSIRMTQYTEGSKRNPR